MEREEKKIAGRTLRRGLFYGCICDPWANIFAERYASKNEQSDLKAFGDTSAL